MNYIKIPLLLLGMIPLLLVAPAHAVVNEDGTAPEAAPGEVQITSVQPEDDAPETTLEERLEARKLNREQRITTAQSQRLRARCAAAQGKIEATRGRIEGVKTRRTQAYETLNQKLQDMVTRLGEQAIDISALEQTREGLRERIGVVSAALEGHTQVVSDLVEMDCAADPEAFQASLEEARSSRQEVVVGATAVREYIVTSLKPALQELKTQLRNNNADKQE